MMRKADIFLVPGFFGFANVGGITYFHHVRECLERHLKQEGIQANIHAVATLPTSSIERRAAKLLEAVQANDSGGELHIVGHSTGGVDARLLVSPADLPGVDLDARESTLERVKSVVSVCSPHRGTPMANFFDSVSGHHLLYLMSLTTIYTMQFGKLPLGALIALGGILTKLDDVVGFDNTIIDQIYDGLLDDFDADKQAKIRGFLKLILDDRTLISDLRPENMAAFNDRVLNRFETRYGCVIMAAPKPGLTSLRHVGWHPYALATHALYTAMYTLASRGFDDVRLPEDHDYAMEAAYGTRPTTRFTDGVVPTLSHPWGEVIYVGQGDHLDVCGHFDAVEHHPPHIDWLKSSSEFTRVEFEDLWTRVAAFIAESGRAGTGCA